MKRMLSMALATVMVFTAFAMLIPGVSAASSGEAILYQENFDSLESTLKNEALFNALGWHSGWDDQHTTITGGGTKDALSLGEGVSGKGLTLMGDPTLSGGYDSYYVLLEDEQFSNGVTRVEYDFKYHSSSSSAVAGDFSRGLIWNGNGTASRADSWNMLLRMDRVILNDYRKTAGSGGWGSAIDDTHYWSDDTPPLDTWYTARFEINPEYGVTVWIKPQGSSEWTHTYEWSDATFDAHFDETTTCFEEFLGIQVQPGVTVTIDNLRVFYDASFPQFLGYQTKSGANDTVSLRLISVLDSMKYEKIGYRIKMTTLENNRSRTEEKDIETRYVYETLDGKPANQLTGAIASAEYLFAVTIPDLPAKEEITYSVTPYVVENGKTVYGKKITFTYVHDDWREDLPTYATAGGVVRAEEEVSDSIWRVLITNTNRSEYDTYRNTLVSRGYTLYAENTINQNHYATYKNDGSMVHVYFDAVKNRSRVLYAPIGVMVDYDLTPVSDGTNVATPTLAFMTLDYTTTYQQTANNGMGFVYTMSDGSYVIIDGGMEPDTDKLYEYLNTNNKRADGKILIRAWVITHYHEDHYGNFVGFSKKYANQVTLEAFVANFDALESAVAPSDMTKVLDAMERFDPEKYVVPQVGQKMYFGEVQMEFLLTQELLYPDFSKGNGNNMSLVAKVTFEGKTMLMTGDAYPDLTGMEAAYGSYLKSDYVQTPHHGYEATSDSFYDKVDADFAFVTTSDAECERRIERGAANSGADKSNFGGLHHLIRELNTPYTAAGGAADKPYYTITYETRRNG